MASSHEPRVLIVDDRPEVAATMARLCRSLGYGADVADAPGDIRALIQRHDPAALIMDLMMPGQDGYEALKEIAALSPNLPVLLVSGYGETWLRVGVTLGEAHGLRALHTAAKPVRTETIRNFLSAVARAE